MRQSPQAIDLIADTFALTGGEARMLLAAGRGEALLLAGSHRVGFQTVASDREHQLAADGLEFALPREIVKELRDIRAVDCWRILQFGAP